MRLPRSLAHDLDPAAPRTSLSVFFIHQSLADFLSSIAQHSRHVRRLGGHGVSRPLASTIDDLLAEVADEVRGPAPAESVEARFGVRPGGDIGVAPRRGFATDATPEKSLLDLTPAAQALLARKAAQRGLTGPESEHAKAIYDNAAMVAALVKDGAFPTSEDRTPGRWVNPNGVAGHTAGQSYGR